MNFHRWLAGLALAVFASASVAGPVFNGDARRSSIIFQDSGPATTTGFAYAEGCYYSSTGGGQDSPYVRYGDGSCSQPDPVRGRAPMISSISVVPTPRIDFRSLFVSGDRSIAYAGKLLARGYNSNTIWVQTSLGNFAPLLTLNGGPLDSQSAVVLNGTFTEFVARNGSQVSRWDLGGSFLGTINLLGLAGSELNYPQNRGLAAFGNYLLTYDDGLLSAWDMMGNRVDNVRLIDGGTSFDSFFSYSVANGNFWVVDEHGSNWRGFNVFERGVPEPGSLVLLALAATALLAMRRRR